MKRERIPDNEAHQHPFPMLEPEVVVIARPEAKLKEILRIDAGGFFVPLQVGAEALWSFYDWPERQLTSVSCTRVVGTINYRGEECLDISDITFWGEDAGCWRTRWLDRVAGEMLTILLREIHQKDRTATISEVDITPEPLRLKVGDRWEGHEIYRCGPEQSGVGEVQHAVVDGPFEVELPAGKTLCLRKSWWTLNATGIPRHMAELYVADSGRSVYFRRFNGPAWRNYADLAGNPEREFEGVRWRLWYECLPDISLRADAGAAPR
jgi:hypothetical protein